MVGIGKIIFFVLVDIKAQYRTASFVGNDCVVFNIAVGLFEGALDHVLQFADIARIIVVGQKRGHPSRSSGSHRKRIFKKTQIE